MRINSYRDISRTFDLKIKAAECHKSQFEKYKRVGLDVSGNLTTLAMFRGIQANCHFAEGFQVIKQVSK
jgi:LmbE family N-acetylglucosaminyl deacetylase